ncbi:uncharacterized protein LOC131950909 [Physella acuta]|uniref:uncharacterized protein LOC131950909 n=1 Tax=Physella acuta TaxID=109671 RepID=UPI0027DCFE3E|nr:uncharacterized protein LOC131950909 [Physella acuta]
MDYKLLLFLTNLAAYAALGTTASCTENDILTCSKGMTDIVGVVDINAACKIGKEAADCLLALQPSCDEDIKSKIDMGLSQVNRLLGACSLTDSDCTVMKCISSTLTNPQTPASLEDACRIAGQASNCLAEQKVKCAGDQNATDMIERLLPGLQQMLANCPSSDSDCNVMKCMNSIVGLPQSPQNQAEACKLAKETSNCFTELKAKCAGNQQTTSQIEAVSPGILQMLANCKDNNEEDEEKKTGTQRPVNNRQHKKKNKTAKRVLTQVPVENSLGCRGNVDRCMADFDHKLFLSVINRKATEETCKGAAGVRECVHEADRFCQTSSDRELYSERYLMLTSIIELCTREKEEYLTTDLLDSPSTACNANGFYLCKKGWSRVRNIHDDGERCRILKDSIECSIRLRMLCPDVKYIRREIHAIYETLNMTKLYHTCIVGTTRDLMQVQFCLGYMERYRSNLGPIINKEDMCTELPVVKECARAVAANQNNSQVQEMFGWVTEQFRPFEEECRVDEGEKTKNSLKGNKMDSKNCAKVRECLETFTLYRRTLTENKITRGTCRSFSDHKKCVQNAAGECKNKKLIKKAKQDIQSAKKQCKEMKTKQKDDRKGKKGKGKKQNKKNSN